MARVAFAVYREWAFNIFVSVEDWCRTSLSEVEIPLLISTPEREFSVSTHTPYGVVECLGSDQDHLIRILREYEIDTVFFYGWSWLVRKEILDEFTCICLHPSPLPRYRGGSPIQHQLVAGETQSAVSIMKMQAGIDDGDLYTQIPFSLDGYLPAILGRITDAGTVATKQYLSDMKEGKVQFMPQTDIDRFPPLRRRKPSDGEVSILIQQHQPYASLYNLVRGLQTPYPSAFIQLKNGMLSLIKIEYVPHLPPQVMLLTDSTSLPSGYAKPLAVKTSDGYGLVTEFTFTASAG